MTSTIATNLTKCPTCNITFDSSSHFYSEQHYDNLRKQKFRFRKNKHRVTKYRDWVKGNEIYNPHNKLENKIRIEFLEADVENHDNTQRYGAKYQKDHLYTISGYSSCGAQPYLKFTITNSSASTCKVFAPSLKNVAIPPVLSDPETEIPLEIEIPKDSEDLGLKYYELQFWVEFSSGTMTTYSPFVALVKWNFFDGAVEQQINNIVKYIPTNNPGDALNMALTPQSDSRPNTAPVKNRGHDENTHVLAGTKMTHSVLQPYYKVWENTPEMSIENRKVHNCLPDYPNLTKNDTFPRISDIINLGGPVTVNNVPMRMLTEFIGEMINEEDNCEHLGISSTKSVTEQNFNGFSPIFSNRLPRKKQLLVQTNVYVIVELDRRKFKFMELGTPWVTICHRQWSKKYIGYVVGQKQNNKNDTSSLLLLELPADPYLKSALLESGSIEYCPRDNLYLTKQTNPVIDCVISFLLKISYQDNDAVEMTTEALRQQSSSQKTITYYRNAWRSIYELIFCNISCELATVMAWSNVKTTFVDWLDEDQYQIFDAIVKGKRFIFCKAPPGTGKTSAMSAIITQLHVMMPEKNFLCLTSTNAAADVFANKIISELGNTTKTSTIVRLLRQNYETDVPSEYCSNGATLVKTRKGKSKRSQTKNSTKLHTITVCTLDLAILHLINSINCFHLDGTLAGRSQFDVVVMDEAANFDLPRTSVVLPLVAEGQLVMLGDIKQLSAYVTCEKLKMLAGEESAMEFLLNICGSRPDNKSIQLVNNYRSMEQLLQPPNRFVYNETPLVPCFNKEAFLAHDPWDTNDTTLPSTGCILVRHIEAYQNMHGTSWYNPHELTATLRILETLVHHYRVPNKDIGIDATYAAHAVILSELVEGFYPGIKIGCTNAWQGDERDIMLITLARSNPATDETRKSRNRDWGFLNKFRRVNVSITRASRRNIFICNVVHFLEHPLLRECFRECCYSDGWISPMSPAVKRIVHQRICVSSPIEEHHDHVGDGNTDDTMSDDSTDSLN